MEIEKIDQNITTITPLPPLVDAAFYAAANNLYGVEMPNMSTELKTFIPKLNVSIDGINVAVETVIENTELALKSANSAMFYASFKGEWIAEYEEDGYALGDSVSYTDGLRYQSKIKNNLTEPTSKTNTAEWDFIEAVSPDDLALKEDTETVNEKLSLKADTATVNEKLYLKADTQTVNEKFANKTDKRNIKTIDSNTLAVHNDFLFADTSTGEVAITLPENPPEKCSIKIADLKGTFSINKLILLRNGETIKNVEEDRYCTKKYVSFEMIFINNDWRIIC